MLFKQICCKLQDIKECLNNTYLPFLFDIFHDLISADVLMSVLSPQPIVGLHHCNHGNEVHQHEHMLWANVLQERKELPLLPEQILKYSINVNNNISHLLFITTITQT